MRFIEEIVVDAFLPTFRALLAEDLRERGFTQADVAEALGISQSAVSKYAHGEVSVNERVAADARVHDLVARVGAGLATGDMTPVQALVEAEVLIRQLEEGDLLADLHEESMPELAAYDGFHSIHDPEGHLRSVEQVRSSVRRGLRILTNTSGFAGLIPNVGSNLVEALPNATNIDDVAAIPGRIFDVKGKATVPGEPEFGVSEHVASVLLSARAAGVDVNAALNVVYDAGVVDELEAAGYECIEFDPDAPTDPVRAALEDRDLPETFVVYQTGGYGIEPITYILGPDAPTVADVVRILL
ncbi:MULTISPECIES: thiamine-phosphate synthase family protein [Haloferax]|uniref:Helix-turn-helix domain-containing protein n=1 Tax=Haloferax marinum TaxID=2666143 RepID=A0A6A8G5W1_9EURY|nr:MULTISPECIES: thiamine-phosphate synthase family protein [Haloferax]KAB1197105.1 helix-turn-helix domain-containing protein [Haloferax sp. CBA1150]MRW96135.1 helix-turn-helix domain-containing protein [Haloferax marinum]